MGALLALVTAAAAAACGSDGAGATGSGPAMRMTVAACVGEGAGLDADAVVRVVQDGEPVADLGSLAVLPAWVVATPASGTVQLVADGDVLDEATGGPGERVDLAAGTCTTPTS